MKIKTKNNSKKILVITLLGALLVVGLVAAFFFIKYADDQKATQNRLGDIASDSQGDVKNDEGKTSNPSTNPQSNDTPSDKIPVNTSGSIDIAYLNQSDGAVHAKAVVTNFSTEKCVYSFTADGSKPVVREQTGDCKELSVAQDYFDKIGRYNLTVTAYSSNDKLLISREIDVL